MWYFVLCIKFSAGLAREMVIGKINSGYNSTYTM
jgi:hypothetical protein